MGAQWLSGKVLDLRTWEIPSEYQRLSKKINNHLLHGRDRGAAGSSLTGVTALCP